jgi:hypothetical protein
MKVSVQRDPARLKIIVSPFLRALGLTLVNPDILDSPACSLDPCALTGAGIDCQIELH